MLDHQTRTGKHDFDPVMCRVADQLDSVIATRQPFRINPNFGINRFMILPFCDRQMMIIDGEVILNLARSAGPSDHVQFRRHDLGRIEVKIQDTLLDLPGARPKGIRQVGRFHKTNRML